MTTKQQAIARIVGSRLTSVQFVLDYLILGFDEVGALTLLVWPEIIHDLRQVKFGELGYRDDLCSLIEKRIKEAKIDVGDNIILAFDGGSKMHISLSSYALPGERAILTGPRNYLCLL